MSLQDPPQRSNFTKYGKNLKLGLSIATSVERGLQSSLSNLASWEKRNEQYVVLGCQFLTFVIRGTINIFGNLIISNGNEPKVSTNEII